MKDKVRGTKLKVRRLSTGFGRSAKVAVLGVEIKRQPESRDDDDDDDDDNNNKGGAATAATPGERAANSALLKEEPLRKETRDDGREAAVPYLRRASSATCAVT
ncbi:unnamed protein product [Pylaiella littoralis]